MALAHGWHKFARKQAHDRSRIAAILFGKYRDAAFTAGAYTRPLFNSTSAVLVTPLHVPLSNGLGKIMHPTYPTKCAYVEPNSGRA